jgi:hypothetical protein
VNSSSTATCPQCHATCVAKSMQISCTIMVCLHHASIAASLCCSHCTLSRLSMHHREALPHCMQSTQVLRPRRGLGMPIATASAAAAAAAASCRGKSP